MKSNIQIILLISVFVVCSACGYLIGSVLKNSDIFSGGVTNIVSPPVASVDSPVASPVTPPAAQPVQEVPDAKVDDADVAAPSETKVEIPVEKVSTVPVISSVSNPVRDAAGNYSFQVKASVESGDDLKYGLFSDANRQNQVAMTSDGNFTSIAPSSTGSYYLAVVNDITHQWSESKKVSGFDKPVMFEKVTKEELEKICNSGDYGMAPAKFSHRFAPGFVIVANGMKDDERAVKSVSDICQKVMMGTWRSITIQTMEYDSQNRVKKLVFNVNY